jgi:hypothetical protein
VSVVKVVTVHAFSDQHVWISHALGLEQPSQRSPPSPTLKETLQERR